jgi:hypothetical protein
MTLVSLEIAVERLLCLGALLMRSDMENCIASECGENEPEKAASYGEASESLSDLRNWIDDQGLRVSPKEQQLHARPLGTWTKRERTNVSWRYEAAGVIAWALFRIDRLPPFDVQCDPIAISSAIPLFEPVKLLLRTWKLRDEPTLADAREAAELWLWRARQSRLSKHEIQGHGGASQIEERIRSAACAGQRHGWFVAKNEDFPALGGSFRDLTPDQRNEMESIAVERLYGLNWVCALASNWDEIPTDS